nr:RNA-guided endonuclease TnpB family protein [Allostreptomyces psammosilenae]
MDAVPVRRTYRYRFHPTDVQAAELERTFGCVRKVYNLALEVRTRAWLQRQERVSYNDTSAMLSQWKKAEELAFLSEVSSVPLQQALRHLQAAFSNFFGGRAEYPRFKSKKRSRKAAEYTRSGFTFRGGKLTLAKMADPLSVVWSRPLPEGVVPSTVTVSRDGAGRWFVSMLCEDAGVRPLPVTDAAVGIDAGLSSLVTLSTGEKVANPRQEHRDRARLAKAQRELCRKAPGRGANREKARRKVARIYARIADRRRDYLHKLTTRLVRENQTIVIEDLVVSNMMGGRLARAISDAAWAHMRFMLQYKAAWYGRELVVVDRWFPSSRLCSACGSIRAHLPLNVREWTCGCGQVHDRDVNAARNILAAGLAVTVCGGSVRPHRSTPERPRSVKQKVQPAREGIRPVRAEEVKSK